MLLTKEILDELKTLFGGIDQTLSNGLGCLGHGALLLQLLYSYSCIWSTCACGEILLQWGIQDFSIEWVQRKLGQGSGRMTVLEVGTKLCIGSWHGEHKAHDGWGPGEQAVCPLVECWGRKMSGGLCALVSQMLHEDCFKGFF